MTDVEFTTFSKDEFEYFLAKNYPDYTLSHKTNQGKEYVYDIPTDKPYIVLRVYSSVDVRSNLSRDIGKDAIRTVLLNTDIDRVICKAKKTLRMDNWRVRLLEKLKVLSDNVDYYDRDCPECGSKLAVRESKNHDHFWGCSAYPDCTYTYDYIDPSKPSHGKQEITNERANQLFNICLNKGTFDSAQDIIMWMNGKFIFPGDIIFSTEASKVSDRKRVHETYRFNKKASEMGNPPQCPACKRRNLKLEPIYGGDTLLYWRANCAICGTEGTVINK